MLTIASFSLPVWYVIINSKADELIMHQIIKVNFNESIKMNFFIEITLRYVLPAGYSSIKQSVLAHRRLSTLNFR